MAFKTSTNNRLIAKELRLVGNTLAAIGKELGVSRERVRQYLEGVKVSRCKSYFCKCGCGKKTSRHKGYYQLHDLVVNLSIEELIHLNKEGKNIKDIAKLYNVSLTYMIDYVKHLGIKLKRYNRTQPRFNISKEELYDLYITQCQPANKIAKKYGCSKHTIIKLVTKYNLQKRTRFVVSKEELYDLYIVQRLTISEIAVKYNRSIATIYNNLKKYNIRRGK
jgi:transposase